MVADVCDEAVAPDASLTVSVTAYTPSSRYTLLGLAAEEVVPSPKFQLYDRVWPFGSLDPRLENATAAPSLPAYGPFAAATGGSFETVTVTLLDVPVAPSLSFTDSVADQVPG